MSTTDVPGYNPVNNDVLSMGCWAESANKDGSYILVENTENGRVIFYVFDTSRTPPQQYRHAMDEASFKRDFSWGGTGIKWIWHDKTNFPWDVIIRRGVPSGAGAVSAADTLEDAANLAESVRDIIATNDGDPVTDAARVAQDLNLQGQVVGNDINMGRIMRRAFTHVRDGLQRAINSLPR